MLLNLSGSASEMYEQNVRNHFAKGSLVKESIIVEMKGIMASMGAYWRVMATLCIRPFQISRSTSCCITKPECLDTAFKTFDIALRSPGQSLIREPFRTPATMPIIREDRSRERQALASFDSTNDSTEELVSSMTVPSSSPKVSELL